MALFNSDWLKLDQHAKEIIDKGEDISPVLAMVEMEIRSICSFYRVKVSELDLDTGGFITSDSLKLYCIFYGLYRLFSSFHGSARGAKDVYYDKREGVFAEMNNARANITKKSLLADESSDATTGEPIGAEAQFLPLIL